LPVHDVVPAKLPDVFAGQPVVVFGRFDGVAAGVATLRARQGADTVTLRVAIDSAAAPEGTGLGSMWAREQIDDLLGYPRSRPDAREQNLDRVIALALEHRIMTAYTSFVAVDERHIVNPDGRVETVQVPVEMPRNVAYEGVFGDDVWGGLVGDEIGESFGVGGLGLTGTGRGGGGATGSIGYGRGSGAGFGGKGTRVPRVRSGAATVVGSIDKDLVRRIIRRHLAQVRKCYETALTNDPSLAGKIVLELVVAADGEVVAARVAEDGLSDATVGVCMAKAASTWKFPPNPAGPITIRYPFVFAPG
jgi:Ca-activated chloride channel family protein